MTWKRSNTVPIPKSGDKASPANYKPVSLLGESQQYWKLLTTDLRCLQEEKEVTAVCFDSSDSVPHCALLENLRVDSIVCL